METEVTVREIMTREYLGVSESDTVGAAVDLMLEEGARCIVILRGAEPVGTLTSTDALERVTAGDDPGEVEVQSVMSDPVPSIGPDATVPEAAGAMADGDVGSLLVRSGEALEGIVSERDVVRATATLAGHASLSTPGEPADPEPVAATADTGEGSTGAGEGTYSTQSVCEACGSLTADLRNVNGQLICDNCREV